VEIDASIVMTADRITVGTSGISAEVTVQVRDSAGFQDVTEEELEEAIKNALQEAFSTGGVQVTVRKSAEGGEFTEIIETTQAAALINVGSDDNMLLLYVAGGAAAVLMLLMIVLIVMMRRKTAAAATVQKMAQEFDPNIVDANDSTYQFLQLYQCISAAPYLWFGGQGQYWKMDISTLLLFGQDQELEDTLVAEAKMPKMVAKNLVRAVHDYKTKVEDWREQAQGMQETNANTNLQMGENAPETELYNMNSGAGYHYAESGQESYAQAELVGDDPDAVEALHRIDDPADTAGNVGVYDDADEYLEEGQY